MATIRTGNRSALLIVDVQVGVVAAAGDISRQFDRITLAVRKARDAGVPVIWVQHNSSFEQTALAAELAARGVAHVVLCGAVTRWCIRATAYAALERGYDLTLIGDGHIAKRLDTGEGTLVEDDAIVREFNAVLPWLSYPGRRNRVVRAAELSFN